MSNIQNDKAAELPLNAFREIPTPNADAKRITALQRQSGKTVGYQLSDGSLLSKADAISLARSGGIAGVGIAVRRGSEYLKSLPDDTESNNLGSLPSAPAQ